MNALKMLAGIMLWISVGSCTALREAPTQVSDTEKQPVIVVPNPLTLADILRRAPGVYVEQRGAGTIVTVRGGLPLYVIDGVPVGNSYASAASAVNINDISSVEVITDPTKTLLYGRRATYGVILIKTG